MGINPDCISRAVIRELAKALDELRIPKDAVILEKFPGAVLAALPIYSGTGTKSYSDEVGVSMSCSLGSWG